MNKSIWKNEYDTPKFPTLDKDINVDVAIIGGGICGILTAYFLEKSGIDYVLLEGSKIADGTTGNTTAKITSQHGLIYNKFTKENNLKTAKKYLDANQEALMEYKNICKNIDCDFETKDNYVYSVYNIQKLYNETEILNKIGFEADLVKETPLPFKTVGAVRFKNQAQFNPLKFISAISENLNIYENTFAQKIEDNVIITQKGNIKAEKIIVATHFPFINRHGSYFLKLYQQRSYCIALDKAPNFDGMYIDEAENGISFRNYGQYLIVGGGGHRTGKHGGNWQELRDFSKKYFPRSKEEFAWAAQDCMSLDSIPYIGNYSALTPNLFVATGFNKWGMTSSMVAAKILTDKILEKENEFAEIFSPSRNILKYQLLINSTEAVTNLLNFKTKRCPHLGCSLVWNSAEHSWDCPCHGSRFNREGKVLENPSTKNLQP